MTQTLNITDDNPNPDTYMPCKNTYKKPCNKQVINVLLTCCKHVIKPCVNDPIPNQNTYLPCKNI